MDALCKKRKRNADWGSKGGAGDRLRRRSPRKRGRELLFDSHTKGARYALKYTFKHTIHASYLGYVTQAIVVNLAPLLFVRFRNEFQITNERIGLLIMVNFGVQILTDLVAARYIDRLGYRRPVVLAHILATLGLVLMGVLPGLMPAYAGLVLSTVCMAVGGGLIEVLISPIVEACPGDEKAAAMSLLHSFYSWGQAFVVLASTMFFWAAGIQHWRFLPMIWALIPALNIFLFARVPLRALVEDHQRAPLRKLFSAKIFWVLLLLMIGSGAAEQAMAQWSSMFAELGLGVPKTMGDLLGPFTFAILMGVSRLFYGIKGSKIKLSNMLMVSACLCVVGYLAAVFSPQPMVSLLGCSLCGLAVGIMWPGTLSLSSRCYAQGGVSMFAVLALAGDVGCSSGPGLVGLLSSAAARGAFPFIGGWFSGTDPAQLGLKFGLLCAIIFPALVFCCVSWLRRRSQ